MAFSFVSAGAESNLTAAGTLAPGLPAGYQAGDIFILITTTETGTALANPSGYTNIDSINNAAVSIRVSRKIATSSETAPTFSVSFASRAVILCYRSSLGLGVTVESSSSRSASSSVLAADNLISTQSTNLVITTWGTASTAATLTGNAGFTTRFTGNPTAAALGILSTDAVRTVVDTDNYGPPNASSSAALVYVSIGFVLRENSTVYWVGGTGNWNGTNAVNWSLSSGGTGSQSIPKSTDSVVIDSSSGTGTITCSSFAECNDLTVTASQAITLSAGNLTLYGSISTPSGGSFALSTTFTFAATTTGKTITTNGKSFSSLTFNGTGGGWTLQDNLNTSGGAIITLDRGTLNLNNQNVTCASFQSNSGFVRTFTMGSGTFTILPGEGGNITVWNVTSSNFTFNSNTSTIQVRQTNNTNLGIQTFAGGGLTYNNLTFANAVLNNAYGAIFAITGANTFNTIASTRTLGYTIQLPTGVTTTVSTWSANGLLQNPLTLRSATAGTTGTLAVTNTFTNNYTFVRDINLTVLNRGTVDNGLIVNSANWALGSGSSFGDILTSGTSWTVPSTWTSGNNTVHIFGGGGGGAGGITTTIAGGAGGGGGGYAQLVNYSATPSNVIRYSIGSGGSGAAGSASSSTGISGGTTGFNGTIQTISFVSSAVSVQNTAATTITATVPSVSNGNLMILIANSSSTSATWTTPAGWTLGAVGSQGRALFWRIASSEPASYVLTQSASNTSDAIILVFSNATFNTSGLADQSTSGTIQPINISVAEANSTIVYVASTQSVASATYTTPTGYTSRAVDSDATAPSCSVFSLANVAAGTYTAPTTTQSTGNGRAYVIALSPVLGAFTASATGGSGGSSATGPTSTGGAGGTGSGGSLNYTGGTGGAGATSGSSQRNGGGGGGAAGPNGNGGNGGAGGGNTSTNSGAGGGGGNGGGTAGTAGSSVSRIGGAGGNNSLGTGGGATNSSAGDGNSGTRGGGGSGGTGGAGDGGAGGDGIDIANVIGGGGGSGGGNQVIQNQSAGLYGGGGGGAGVSGTTAGTGGAGATGAIIILWGTTSAVTATGNFFFLFM